VSRKAQVQASGTDLTFLKVQLKYLEILALQSPVMDEQDDMLRRGIEAWKRDWKDVDSRLKSGNGTGG